MFYFPTCFRDWLPTIGAVLLTCLLIAYYQVANSSKPTVAEGLAQIGMLQEQSITEVHKINGTSGEYGSFLLVSHGDARPTEAIAFSWGKDGWRNSFPVEMCQFVTVKDQEMPTAKFLFKEEVLKERSSAPNEGMNLAVFLRNISRACYVEKIIVRLTKSERQRLGV